MVEDSGVVIFTSPAPVLEAGVMMTGVVVPSEGAIKVIEVAVAVLVDVVVKGVVDAASRRLI